MKDKKYLALLSAIMCVPLTSCGDKEPSKYEKQGSFYINKESKAVVMILGNHACAMKAPEDIYNSLEKDMDNIVYGGYFAIINADSTPTKVEIEEPNFFVQDRKSLNATQYEINKRKKKIKAAIREAAEIPPDSAESDLLQAIREAKSILSGCSSVKKEIIIADTGISTAGDLNLCSISFDENPSTRRTAESIIDEYLLNFEGRNIMPDLSGIDVVFYGQHGNMAPAASPQNDNMLTTDSQYIKELWEAVVRESGAASISFTEIAGWDTPILEGENFPHVSPVLFKRLIPPTDLVGIDDTWVPPPKINFSISESEIGFEANNASLVSLDNFVSQFNTTAIDIQTYLDSDSNAKLYIAGAVAKYGDDNGYNLSYQRAEKIKQLLTDGFFKDGNGEKICINADKIAIIGLGDRFPDKVDEYPDGGFVEALGAQNRKVFIFAEIQDDDGTSYYEKLKNAYENGELNPETMKDIEKAFN
ncbi:MAG: hypothetical protein K2I00_01575 [Ruminococcus sp.]|nr:hypothetical protein [Ruminococcus sp.]